MWPGQEPGAGNVQRGNSPCGNDGETGAVWSTAGMELHPAPCLADRVWPDRLRPLAVVDVQRRALIRWFGPLSACAVALLGCAAALRAESGEGATEALRALGTLMTVVMGLFSALWWHQSATLPDRPSQSEREHLDNLRRSSLLNGAAATATGLALLGGVYSGLTWSTLEGAVAALAFLLLLGMSGAEMWLATRVSLRNGLTPRSALAFGILILSGFVFVVRHLVL